MWWTNRKTGALLSWDDIELDTWYGPDDIPSSIYHGIAGISEPLPGKNSTRIKRADKSIAHMLLPQPVTKVLRDGAAAHTLILEGEDVYRDEIAVAPPEVRSRRHKGWLEWLLQNHQAWAIQMGNSPQRAVLIREHVARFALLAKEDLAIRRMADAVMSHKIARKIIEKAEKEQTLWYRDPDTGLLCKIRVDMRLPYILADLKTSRDASWESFGKDAANLGYHVSAAHYQLGADPHIQESRWVGEFLFVVVENEEPHGVQIHKLGLQSMAAGRHIRDRALRKIAEWEESGKPDPFEQGGQIYEERINDVELPRWALHVD